MSKKDKPAVTPRLYWSREQVAHMLKLDGEVVSRLACQGRLEVRREDGEERYEVISVLRFRAEDLIRATLERAKDECPELYEQIEELASLQYQRGRMDEVVEIGDDVLSQYPMIEEAIKEAFREIHAAVSDVEASSRQMMHEAASLFSTTRCRV